MIKKRKKVKKERKGKDQIVEFKLSPQEEYDLKVDALPKKERELQIRKDRLTYKDRRKNGDIVKKGTLHSSVLTHIIKNKNKTHRGHKDNDWIVKKKEEDKVNAEFKKHIESGGSAKDKKALKILSQLRVSESKTYRETIYSKKLRELNKTVVPLGNGETPTLLDFGVTFKEAKFITTYVKDYDELKAGYESKLIIKGMKKIEIDEILNETLNNPNVATAIKSVVSTQIQRTLITADRTVSQIGKMAFCDPIDLYADGTDGQLRPMHEIPQALRVCISQMEHKTVFSGRGDNRVVTGYITKIKMHDSLKALQVLLKDIREKTNKAATQLNQFNIYGPSNFNLQERIGDLDDKELDLLIKLSGSTKEDVLAIPEKTGEKDEDPNIFDLIKSENKDLYSLDELKDIETCNLEK